jgi:predicted HTH transcriptional regulator
MAKMFPNKIDQDFVNLLLKEEEGLKLEYKQQISSQEKIAKTLSAMSNTAGGMILIGISDQRKIIGIDPEEERYMIAAANESFCVPQANLDLHVVSIDPDNLYEEEKYVLLVIVHASPDERVAVKLSDGSLKIYRRVGDKSLASSIETHS